MRTTHLAALAAALATPAVTRAQATLYPDRPVAFAGCDDLFGTFCVNGTGTLSYRNVGDGQALIDFAGTITPYLGPPGAPRAAPAAYGSAVDAAFTPIGSSWYLALPGAGGGGFGATDFFGFPAVSLRAPAPFAVSLEFEVPSLLPPYGTGAPRFSDARFDYGFLVYGVTTTNGNRDITHVRFTPTPEPASFALTLGGLAVLGVGAWRRRRAA